MTQNWHDWVWRLGLTTLAVSATLLDSTAHAQITPDDTLGAEGSRVRPNATVQGEPADLIEGGAVRNANLFHSFQEFNVEEQQRVYFDNPPNIDNIFSRVTGGNPSNILGTLGVNGLANLFLLNPNGILFGADASLDVQGSFLATTGNGFLFEDNEVFSATNPTAPSLLAVSVPLGVQYGANEPGAITVQGSTLRVDEAQSLILAGGEVVLEGASLAVALLENGQVVGVGEGGRIDIGTVAGAGTLELTETNNLLGLRFPEDLARADVRLTDTTLNVQANNGGDLAITAQNIDILEASGLLAGIAEGLGFPGSQAGDIRLNATGAMWIDRGSLLNNALGSDTVGTGGNVEITTGTLRVSNGAQLSASTFGQGDAGDVIINAHDRVSFNFGFVFSSVASGAVGTGGIVEITTDTLRVSNGAQLSASTFGQGDAGDIIINARDRVSFDGGSARSIVESGVIGTGGRVEVTTGTLEVSNGAQLSARTFGQGDAGDIIITARDRVSFDFGSAVSSVGLEAVGTGGTVEITTGTLQVNNETLLSASTFGEGNAGDIIINARDRVSFDGGSILSASTFGEGNAGDIIINARDRVSINGLSDVSTRVSSNAIGTGGDIVITTRVLSVTDALGLLAGTSGRGDSGDIIINARDLVSFDDGSFASTRVSSDAFGTGGDVVITTGTLSVTNGAELLAETSGQGDAGDVIINARDRVSFDNSDASTRVSSDAIGTGGDVVITTRALSVTNGALFAETRGRGRAGNVIIRSAESTTLSDGSILTETSAADRGGDIEIHTGSLALTDAEISASTRAQGNAGNINLAVTDSLTATNSEISTSATSEVASGGNITIRANTIGLRNNSDIETNVAGAGTGGDIVVTAGAVVAYDDSDILAYALDGSGGNVQFNTDLFLGEGYRPAPEGIDLRSLDGNDRVDVNASGATPGSVSLPDISFIQNSLSELPQVPIDPDQLLANSCIARSDPRGSFIVTGAGGLPSRPGTAAASPFPTGIVQAIPQERRVDASNEAEDEYRWQPGEPIVEPQGVYQLPNGRLVMSRECSQM